MKYKVLFSLSVFAAMAVLTLSQINLVNAQTKKKPIIRPITAPITGHVVIGRLSPCDNIGDVDQDGLVTIADSQAVLKIVAKINPYKNPTSEQIRRADVDANKRVSSVDALRIAQYATYRIYTFPACSISK